MPIMQNATNFESKKNQRLTFDLKGSFIGRKTKLLYERNHGSAFARVGKCNKVLKDVNYLELTQDDRLV